MSQFGDFDGPIAAELDPGGRKLTLLRPVTFTAPDNVKWPVPEGAVVDGASIPQAFWSVLGGPLDGPYRDASVIHDYYCDHHQHTWKDTHRVFYYGMRARNVDEIKAKVMYYAVYNFGPRWPMPGAPVPNNFSILESVRTNLPVHHAIIDQKVDYHQVPGVAAIVDHIEADNPSLEDIEKLPPGVTM